MGDQFTPPRHHEAFYSIERLSELQAVLKRPHGISADGWILKDLSWSTGPGGVQGEAFWEQMVAIEPPPIQDGDNFRVVGRAVRMRPQQAPSPAELDRLVQRFLSWPLPSSVCADLCATQHGAPHRSGTNLLSAVEARQMIEHLLAGEPEAVSASPAEPVPLAGMLVAPTGNLRFVLRDEKRILQHELSISTVVPRTSRTEWHDVPLCDETSGFPV